MLSAGTRFGPYEIVNAIGAGGMGEVCRGRDPRLRRDVAIKVLPTLVAADHERLARFEREAQALAALSHPHCDFLVVQRDPGDRHLNLAVNWLRRSGK